MASPQTEMPDASFERVFKQALPIQSVLVVTNCFEAISKLVQTQIKRLPLVQPTFTEEGKELFVILQQLKLSVRTLSEDAWSVFQTITNLMKYEDWAENQIPVDGQDSMEYQANPHLITLRLQLKSLETRLKDPQASSNGDQITDATHGPMRLESDTVQGIRMATDLADLNIKMRDVYKASADLGAYSGKDCPLRCLSKVLSELDALLALMENDFGTSHKLVLENNLNIRNETCTDKTSSEQKFYINSKDNGTNSQNTVELGSAKGDKKPDDLTTETSAGIEHSDEVTTDTTLVEPVRQHPNEKLIRRSKYSDTLVRTIIDGVEVVQVGSVPDRKHRSSKKKKTSRQKDSDTSCPGSDISSCTMSDDSLQLRPTSSEIEDLHRRNASEQVREATSTEFEKDSIQELIQTEDGTELDTVSNSQLRSTSSTESSQSDEQEFKSLQDSQSDNGNKGLRYKSTVADKQALDTYVPEPKDVEKVLELDRRESLTDLQVCVDESLVPHPSIAQWDMIPTTTLSCPDIASSTSLQEWSGYPISNKLGHTPTGRQKRLKTLLYLSLTAVFFMAVFNIIERFTAIPVTDNLRTLISDYSALLNEDVAQRVQRIQSLATLDKLSNIFGNNN